MKRVKIENVIMLLTTFLIIIATALYFYFSPTTAKDLATYLSGISTVGILVLTAFYVFYTNRQIVELKSQTQLQVQPLPNINITKAIITPPRIVTNPDKPGSIQIIANFFFKYKMKNIGNGAAVLIDSFGYFGGAKIEESKEKHFANRELVLEDGKEIEGLYDITDCDFRVLKQLNEGGDNKCPGHSAFDVLIRFHVLYKNILGQAFFSSLDHIVAIDGATQRTISNWLGAIESFETTFALEIAKFKATHRRNKEEAYGILNDIAEEFYKSCPIEVLEVEAMPLIQTFKINPISESTVSSISKDIFHGIPIGRMSTEETEDNKFSEWKEQILNAYFGNYLKEIEPEAETAKGS